ncbi:transposase [Pseudomonas aeruginosa]
MKKRFTEEQILDFLKQAEAGVPVKELCRRHGFSDANLVESVFRAGDGSEKAFYRRADSRLPQAGGGRCAGEGTVSPTRLQ